MSKDQKITITIYVAFIIGFLSNFIPSPSIQMVGGIIFLLAIPAAYIIRSKNEVNNFTHTHMQFLIKTFWIASLFLLIGAVSSVFLADHTRINEVVDGMTQGIAFSQAEVNAILIQYMFDNLIVFTLCIGPSLLYLAYRIMKGLIQAVNNHNINTPKNWF